MRQGLPRAFLSISVLLAIGLVSTAAWAEGGSGGSPPPGSVVVPSEGGGQVVVAPGSTNVTNVNAPGAGLPQAGTDLAGQSLVALAAPPTEALTERFSLGGLCRFMGLLGSGPAVAYTAQAVIVGGSAWPLR